MTGCWTRFLMPMQSMCGEWAVEEIKESVRDLKQAVDRPNLQR